MYGNFRRPIGRTIRELCRQRGVGLVEGHAMADQCLRIPRKYSVAHTIGLRN